MADFSNQEIACAATSAPPELMMAMKQYATTLRTAPLIAAAAVCNQEEDLNRYYQLLLLQMLSVSSPDMLSELGDKYYYGSGVKRNREKGVLYYLKAAQSGSIRAQYDLGWYYYDQKEWMRAIEAFSICLDHQELFPNIRIGKCYYCMGVSYINSPTPQLQQGIENLTIAADKYHHAAACGRLAEVYSKENTPNYEPDRASHYLQCGAKYGDAFSAHRLALDYISGNPARSCEKNYRMALDILRPFEDKNSYFVMHDLGMIYLFGDEAHGIKQDYHMAEKYFAVSWDLLHDRVTAAHYGYTCFCLGKAEKAKELLLFAYQNGYILYSDFLARMYNRGMLGERNVAKALEYYQATYQAKQMSNCFTCIEYAELLEETGQYTEAYDVAEYGESEYREAFFLFFMVKLILSGKVPGKGKMDEVESMMEACIQQNIQIKEAHMLLGQYFQKVQQYRNAEAHYIKAFEAGASEAGVLLGYLYEKGGGSITPSAERAYRWFTAAANAGSACGREEMACFKKALFGGYRRVRENVNGNR